MLTFIIPILATTILGVSTKIVPEYLHICHRKDPNVNGCIKQSVEDMRPYLIKGIPELAVPSIEPLLIEELIATQGTGLTVTTKNLKAYGGGNFTIKTLNVDFDNHKYHFTLGFPHLSVDGDYDVDGKIIMIPIRGEGTMHSDVYDVEGIVTMRSEMENKNGIDQLKFTHMEVDVTVGSGKILLNNLFGGDKLIGDVINSAINLNFQYFLKELKPIISQTLSEFIIKSANNICDGLPYYDLLPE